MNLTDEGRATGIQISYRTDIVDRKCCVCGATGDGCYIFHVGGTRTATCSWLLKFCDECFVQLVDMVSPRKFGLDIGRIRRRIRAKVKAS